jgi:hypothetical protein
MLFYGTFAIHITKHRGRDVDREDVIARMEFKNSPITEVKILHSRIREKSDTCDKTHFDMEPTASREMRWRRRAALEYTRELSIIYLGQCCTTALIKNKGHLAPALRCPRVVT